MPNFDYPSTLVILKEQRYNPFNMKALLIIIILLNSSMLIAQKEVVPSKKELRKAERLEKIAELRRLVNSQYFYIDNFQLFDRYQNTKVLAASNNFIKVTGDDLLLQTSFSNVDGINGLGGLTLQGKIISYEISDPEKKGPLNLQVIFSTKTFGHTTLNINFYEDLSCRTQFSGFYGLEVFLLGNVKSNYSILAANQGVPSF